MIVPIVRLTLRDANELGTLLGPWWMIVFKRPARICFFHLGCAAGTGIN